MKRWIGSGSGLNRKASDCEQEMSYCFPQVAAKDVLGEGISLPLDLDLAMWVLKGVRRHPLINCYSRDFLVGKSYHVVETTPLLPLLRLLESLICLKKGRDRWDYFLESLCLMFVRVCSVLNLCRD